MRPCRTTGVCCPRPMCRPRSTGGRTATSSAAGSWRARRTPAGRPRVPHFARGPGLRCGDDLQLREPPVQSRLAEPGDRGGVRPPRRVGRRRRSAAAGPVPRVQRTDEGEELAGARARRHPAFAGCRPTALNTGSNSGPSSASCSGRTSRSATRNSPRSIATTAATSRAYGPSTATTRTRASCCTRMLSRTCVRPPGRTSASASPA